MMSAATMDCRCFKSTPAKQSINLMMQSCEVSCVKPAFGVEGIVARQVVEDVVGEGARIAQEVAIRVAPTS